MPAWLTPRIRLGATALLIVLIAGALLVTPQLFHEDNAHAPGSLTSVNASIDLHTVPPPPSRKPPIVLPHVVLDEPDVTPRPPSPRRLSPGDVASQTAAQADSADSTESGSDLRSPTDQRSTGDSAGPSYSLGSDGSAGPNQSAANGVMVPPSGCADCSSGGPRGGTPKPQQPIPLGYDNGGGSAPGPVAVPSITPPSVIQPIAPPPNGSGSGDDPGPPIEPPIEPPDPPVVQVPEPTSFVMAGMGALGFMIRRLARKRRG